MPKALSIALFVVGIVLLIFAAFAGDSVSSNFSNIFKGTPDARTLTLLIAGLLATIIGGVGLFRGVRA
jgi:hypothetical protein